LTPLTLAFLDKASYVFTVAALIKDKHFECLAKGVKPDRRKRFLLSKIRKTPGGTFDVYQNSVGQIVLDPRPNISDYEAGVLHNPKVRRSVIRGLKQSAEGNMKNLGSFAAFATDDDDERA
jgi:hypothetical protein